jgi:hypothetical protein
LKQLDKLNFDKETLVAFYLGGKIEGMNIEAHDVRFFIGTTLDDFLTQIKKSWVGVPKSLHIDSWLSLTQIDGYDVKVSSTQNTQNNLNKLFFINLGFYQTGTFGELHSMKFIVAENKEDAKKIAKNLITEETDTLHTDNLYDVDECIQLDSVGDFFINLDRSSDLELPKPVNGWMRLPR